MSIESEEDFAAETLDAGDYERATQLLLPLARQGSANAMNLLGWMHECGKIGGASKIEAAAYYGKAAERGITGAFYRSGTVLLECGDEIGAREAFEKGVAFGSMQAMYGLGRCFSQGRTESERQEALSWFERAAAMGHIPSQRWLLHVSMKRSLFDMFMFVPRLFGLVFRVAKVFWKDKHSEMLY